jgi:hypothetical protein
MPIKYAEIAAFSHGYVLYEVAGNKIRDGKTLRKLHCPELVSIRIGKKNMMLGVESSFCDV